MTRAVADADVDGVEVVFRPDPTPEVVRRRPVALTVVWVAAIAATVFAVAVVAWRVLDDEPGPSDAVLEIGELRSLTDGGARVDLRCDQRAPTVFGSPCLGDPVALRALLAGRERVRLVVNVASVRRPAGAIRCIDVTAAATGTPTVARIVCPAHGWVPAPRR